MELLHCRVSTMNTFGLERGSQPTDALFYVLEGRFSLTVGGKTTEIGSGTLVAFPHDMPFERKILAPLTFYFVKLAAGGELPHGVVSVKDHRRLVSSLAAMEQALMEPADRALAQHFLTDIFMQLKSEARAAVPPRNSVVEAALRYMRDHLAEKMLVSVLAREMGVSVSSFTKQFREATGVTPMRYVAVMRLRLAEELLVTTDASLGEIALRCGYDTPFYLSNAFKKETGLSPKAYRQQYRI